MKGKKLMLLALIKSAMNSCISKPAGHPKWQSSHPFGLLTMGVECCYWISRGAMNSSCREKLLFVVKKESVLDLTQAF